MVQQHEGIIYWERLLGNGGENTSIEEEHKNLKVLRALDQAECDRIADFMDAKLDGSIGASTRKVNRKILYEFGKFLPKFGVPSNAMMGCAESDKMSQELVRMGVPEDKVQNEATSRAMMLAVDFACAPAPEEVSEGSPDLSGLT